MKNFRIFNIAAEPFNADLISGMLWELNILGINEGEKNLQITAEENSSVTAESIKEILDNLKNTGLLKTYLLEEEYLESKNWNEEWEKNTAVIEVDDKFIIRPSFKNYSSPEGKVTLIIDPKMSFGTGEHQTTKLMLQLMNKYFIPDAKVLDVGTGTGILGIAASKLGASEVIAVDNDEWCSLNASENLVLNKIDNMKIILGTVDDLTEGEFDLIFANINYDVLIDIKNKLLDLTKEKGLLILSGILNKDIIKIEGQYSEIGYTALKIEKADEWIGIVFEKN